MDISKIKEITLNILNDEYSLYDIKFIKEYGYDVLQVLVDKKDGISIDELGVINEKLSKELDKIDDSTNRYLLEVSSPGAEKKLRNDQEINEAISKYVHVKLKNEIFEGFLLENNNDNIVLKINIKGRIKNQIIKKDDIKLIRLAVKI